MTNGISHRGCWYYGWNIVAICILSQVAASAMAVNSFSLFLSDWSAQLHMPISSFQLGLGGGGLGCALIAPLVGVCVDRYSSRALFGSGLALMALFCFGMSLVTQPWEFFTLYALLFPVALSFSTATPANAVLSRWFVRRLGLALGLSGFGLAIAGVIMPPVIAAVMPMLGWRLIWRIAGAVIAAIVLPIVLVVLREQPLQRHGTYYLTRDGSAPVPSLPGDGGKGVLTWRDMLSRRNFWLLVVVYLPMMATYGGCGQNIAPLAVSRGLSQHTAGVLLSLLSVSQIVFTLGGGILSDRIGNRLPLAGMAFITALGGLAVA